MELVPDADLHACVPARELRLPARVSKCRFAFDVVLLGCKIRGARDRAVNLCCRVLS